MRTKHETFVVFVCLCSARTNKCTFSTVRTSHHPVAIRIMQFAAAVQGNRSKTAHTHTQPAVSAQL